MDAAWTAERRQSSPEGGDVDELRRLIGYAVLAPSGHNTQPWLFRVRNGAVDLLADWSRGLRVVDPDDRELIMSCGAALEHLHIAAQVHGHELEVEEFPDAAEPGLLATARLGRSIEPDAAVRALFCAMPKRRSTRSDYEPRQLAASLSEACLAATAEHGAAAIMIRDGAARRRIADLVAEADRRQFRDSRFRQELAAWIVSRRSPRRDGMSAAGFGLPDLLSPLGSLLIRLVDLGKGVAAGDARRILDTSPNLMVIATDGDEPVDWLRTGRAVAAVLLTLTANGATSAFLNSPVEVPELRCRLQEVLGTPRVPQLLLRCGYAPPAAPTPRRPVEDVLV